MTRGELAKQNFLSGMNCAQSVLLAFSELTTLDDVTAMKLASSFGGGMGKLREVCGAVSGMFMAAGLLFDEGEIPTQENKAAHYETIQSLAARFRDETGSILCRDLLATVETSAAGAPEERTERYYKERPCADLCALAADILSRYIEENAEKKALHLFLHEEAFPGRRAAETDKGTED